MMSNQPQSHSPCSQSLRLQTTLDNHEPMKLLFGKFTQADVEEILFETPLLLHCGWEFMFKCRFVCAKWNKMLTSEFWWKQLCQVFASDKGLALGIPPNLDSSRSWKRLFVTELWPARHKFNRSGNVKLEHSGFNVCVTARFSPGDGCERRSDFVLPLHQRLRIRKKGEMLSFEAAERGLDENVIKELVGSSQLSPEIVRALMEASKLGHAAHRARVDANQFENEDMAFDDSEGMGEMEVDGDNANGPVANAANNNGFINFDLEPERTASDIERQTRQFQQHIAAPRHGGHPRVLSLQESQAIMYVPGHGIRQFFFENVVKPQASQHEVYAKAAQPIVFSFLNGFNSCLFTYGQTGSGKTYTVFGPPDVLNQKFSNERVPKSAGVVPRACQDVFREAAKLESAGIKVRITAQYVQIYDETITDLISGNTVTLLVAQSGESGSHEITKLQDAHETEVKTLDDVIMLLQQGQERKKVAATACNDHSSRAHTVFILHSSQMHNDVLVKSNLHLVDLAGCEQLKLSQAEGVRRAEAIQINKSLMVLTKCIRALVESKSHVPFRESILTRLLRPSLGGSNRTSTIITGAMDDHRAHQTLQALRFGETVAQITNTVGNASGLSATTALAALTKNLKRVRNTLTSLEARGKTHLEAYQKAARMATALERQCADLQEMFHS